MRGGVKLNVKLKENAECGIKNKIYLSTGSLVERRNGYNWHKVTEVVPRLMEKGFADGAEFMVISRYYENTKEVTREFLGAGITFPVLHSDKEIGTLFSDAAVLMSRGEKDEALQKKTAAKELFKRCCEIASEVGSRRTVLHLWGGLRSDSEIKYNTEWLGELLEISDPFGIKILIENVPSAKRDPLSNWRDLAGYLDRVGLIFDTRFATCHRQPKETLGDKVAEKIEHVHISDYRGGLKEFSCLRPVWHPGEGIADFPLIFSSLAKLSYGGSFTLESPGIVDGCEISDARLEKSLSFIKAMCEKYFCNL